MGYNVYAVSNRKQMVLSHDIIIIMTNAACDVSSVAFDELLSSNYRLILHQLSIFATDCFSRFLTSSPEGPNAAIVTHCTREHR